MSSHDDVLEIMRECRSFDDRGRPVYWPVPPRLMLSLLTSKDPQYQGLAWMLFHTVSWRPVPTGLNESATFLHRTAFASDALGRPLGTKDLANFFRPRWSDRKARQVWQRMDKRGWVEKRDGRLYLRGDCPVAFPVVSEDGPADPAPIDPTTAFIESLPPYVASEVTKLPRAQQVDLVKNLRTHQEWEKEVQADAMMAARDKTQPIRIQIFDAYGIALKVGPKLQAYQEKRAKCAVQLELFDMPVLNLPKQPHTQPVHQSSAVLNSNGTEAPTAVAQRTGSDRTSAAARAADPSSVGGRGVAAPALNDCAPETTPNGSRVPARGLNTEEALAAEARGRADYAAVTGGNADARSRSAAPFVAGPEDARIPDAEFKQSMIAAFVDAGKPHPTPGQVRTVMDALPDHALARGVYLDDLRESLPRILHPGVLPKYTRAFVAAWPAKLDKLEAERARPAKTRADSEVREATAEEIAEHKARGTYVARRTG